MDFWFVSRWRGTSADVLVPVPESRLIDWTTAGVSGGIPTRTTIASTISSAGGNDSTTNTTTIQNAIDAASSGQVVLIPPGIYRTGALTMKTGVTLRGAGDFCKSTSSVTIGTGTKVFTVPAGLGYAAGVQVRVYRPGQRGYYMQGSVTSYSGTTLTLDVTSTSGTGTYADWRVTLTVLKTISGGGSAGFISFGTTGVSSPTVSTNKVVASGATKDSTQITTTSAGPTVTVGQLLVISETNKAGETVLFGASNARVASTAYSVGDDINVVASDGLGHRYRCTVSGTTASTQPAGYTGASGQTVVDGTATFVEQGLDAGATWVDGWNTNGQRARGQIVEVTNVSGTTTQTITFTPALYTDYPNTCWATPFDASVENAGLENMCLFTDSADSHTAKILMRRARNCWVTGVDSDFATRDHAELDWSYRCEIRRCHFYDRFVTDSNYPGLVVVRYKSSLCRVEDNICERLQDSIMLEWGAAGNVVGFNYCFDGYNPSVTSFLVKGITMNHGAHPQFNLIEGNVVTHRIVADSTWGTSSDTLVFRNAAFGFDSRLGPNNARTVDGTSYNMTQVNYALDIWEGQVRYSLVGNVIGNTGNWSSRSPYRKPTYPTNFNYDTNPICIAIGKDSDGLAYTPILADPNSSLFDHGNYDVVTVGQVWTGGYSQTLPNSYAYSAQPSWWDGTVSWPPVNPASPGTLANVTIPARKRYEEGTPGAPTITYPQNVRSVGDFEVESDGATITRTIAETVFKGANASLWDTTAGNGSFSGTSVTTLFIEADAARAPGQSLNANGTDISTSSSFGMRVVQSADANLILPLTHTSAPRVGFHLRWNGAQINSSPRDIAGWHNSQGFFEYLQLYDGATPYFHTHYQGVGFVGGIGSDVNIQKGRWYWVEMAWVNGGATFSISFYDAENGYTLVGTSTNTMPAGSMNLPNYFLIGCIKYSSGGSQTFDFDNIIYNDDGSALPRPTA